MPKRAKKKAAPVKVDFTPVFYTPTITTRLPDGSVVARAGKTVALVGEDEINTAEAADILGCKVSWVGSLCDRGVLREGKDWRRIAAAGRRRGGNYKIKRASVIKLACLRIEEEKFA